MLGSALGDVLDQAGGRDVMEDVERLRKAAIELRQCRGVAAMNKLATVVDLVDALDLDRAEVVARAFTVYFQLVNLAEERHRVRILRQRSHAPVAVAESLTGTLQELRSELDQPSLEALVGRLELRPVLTAHPTEARRRAVVDSLRRIAQLLERLDDSRLSASDLSDARRRLSEQLHILWHTSQLRRQRPAPLDEVRSVMSVFDESLFAVVPDLYRELERASAGSAKQTGQGRAFAGRPFLAWSTWVGGDRDGNPNVTHAVTEAAVNLQSEMVLAALEGTARRLGRTLTMSELTTPPSAGLSAMIEKASERAGAAARRIRARAPGEPHREAMLLAAERLRATRLREPGEYAGCEAFLADLATVQDSLRQAGEEAIAGGELQHLIWQAETFRFHLASMEVRQHSQTHRRVLAELLPGRECDLSTLGALAEGESVKPLNAPSALTTETLETLRSMARVQKRHGSAACRRYVVSFSRSPADLIGVLALARLAVPDGSLDLDVVPLFESPGDLSNATTILDDLLAVPVWRAWLERRGQRLEVMLGYSDASKETGYLAANLALYKAQVALVAWARRHEVSLTLFHGRGGAIGRGGGPAGRAIRSQAPGSVAGRFKVTEQGEVIFARYGNPAIALRHLEQVSSAVLSSSTPRHESGLAAAEKRFAEAAELMAAASAEAYRGLVNAPGFAEFFAEVTPLEQIGQLPLGSRPARRGTDEARGLEGLRAIPWSFAWSQNRCNLPGWFGLGTGLKAALDGKGLAHLKQMLLEWPLLASVVDNAEMSLAKADPMIAGLYLELGRRPDLVDTIRDEYRLTRTLLLELTGRERLLDGHPILQLAVNLRNPYVDALSFLQLRFLRELRRAGPSGARSAQLSHLVRLTLNGIAAGLQNTG